MLLRNGKFVETTINSAALNQIMDDHSSNSACSNDAEGNHRSHSSRSDISPPHHTNLDASPVASPRPIERDDSWGRIDPQDPRHILPNHFPTALNIDPQPYQPGVGPRPSDDVVDGDQRHAPRIHCMGPPMGLLNGYASTARTYSDHLVDHEEGQDFAAPNYRSQDYLAVDPDDSPLTRTVSRTSHELPNGHHERSHYVDRDDEALASMDHNPTHRGGGRRDPRVLEMTSPAHMRMDSQPHRTPHHPRRRWNPNNHAQPRNLPHDQEDDPMDHTPHAYAPPHQPTGSSRTRLQDRRHLDRTPSHHPNLVSAPEAPQYPNTHRRRTTRSGLSHGASHQQASMTSHVPLPTHHQMSAQPSYFDPPPPASAYDQTYGQTYDQTYNQPTNEAYAPTYNQTQRHSPPTLLTATTRETPFTDNMPYWSPGASAAQLYERRQSYIPILGIRDQIATSVHGQGFGGVGDDGEDMGRELDMLGSEVAVENENEVPQQDLASEEGHQEDGYDRQRRRREREGVQDMDVDVDGDGNEEGAAQQLQQENEQEEENTNNSRRRRRRRRSDTSSTPRSDGHEHEHGHGHGHGHDRKRRQHGHRR